jgi:hydroxymethylglutaryl-CoA synthase
MSVLHADPRALDGEALGLFSYGSGSCAEFWSGTVTPGAQAKIKALGLESLLSARRQVSVAEYEQIMTAREGLDTRPVGAQVPAFRFAGVENNRRMYTRS